MRNVIVGHQNATDQGSVRTMAAADGREFSALRWPGRSPQAPVVILAHEIFGLNAFVRERGAWLSGLGYEVVAPDLFWRAGHGIELDPANPEDHQRGVSIMQSIARADMVVDLRATIAAVARARERGLGAVGYCLGGALVFELAVAQAVHVAVGYYPIGLAGSLDKVKQNATPMLVHLAANDRLYPADTLATAATAVMENPNMTCRVYPGVDHAFARAGSSAYAESAAAVANALTVKMLEAHLGAVPRR